MKREFTEQEKAIIFEMNKKHYSYKQIAKKLECSEKKLYNYFKDNNIKKNFGKKVEHDLNVNFFKEIKTEEQAYLLGLLKTDGYVKKGKGETVIGISLKAEDKYMIEKIKQLFNSKRRILMDKRVEKECYGIEISSDIMANDLSYFGIIPNKTYSLTDIELERIPKELQRHYLRGLLDGDGSIGIDNGQVIVSFCGYSYDFVKSYQLAIDKILQKEQHNRIFKWNCYSCRWKGNQNSYKILEFLYNNSTIYLKRKAAFWFKLKNK